MQKYDVIVVGGGAAGLLCAGKIASAGKRVLVVERRERPARKILVTGKGRCNITNNCTHDGFFRAVKTNGKFLYSAFEQFDAQDTMAFFESWGLPLKTERGNRVFPVSERAMDVVDCLLNYTRKSGVKMQQGRVDSLWIENGVLKGVRVDNEKIAGEQVVIATGGLSYPATGSSGDGYDFARQAGHSVTACRASLIPIVCREKWCAEVMGLSLRNVVLRVKMAGKKKPVFEEQGEMLFTHFGISGPLVLSASAHMSKEMTEYQLEIDLKPALTQEQLDDRILRDFSEFLNRDFNNALEKLLPSSLIPVVVQYSGIDPQTKVNQISKEQRQQLVQVIKHLPLTPKSFRPIEEAVITSGGVCVKEINPSTMESKIQPGLFFAGEVLDLDAYTGGYNLQIAFTTGHAAAQGCLQRVCENET